MSEVSLTKTMFHAGQWQGILKGVGDVVPRLRLTHDGEEVATCAAEPIDEGWLIRAPVPAERIGEGVQTFVISGDDGESLASFAVMADQSLNDDLRAEVDLLRAELDLLKQAFRRHCLETAGDT